MPNLRGLYVLQPRPWYVVNELNHVAQKDVNLKNFAQ
jgi:hypothetical protein